MLGIFVVLLAVPLGLVLWAKSVPGVIPLPMLIAVPVLLIMGLVWGNPPSRLAAEQASR